MPEGDADLASTYIDLNARHPVVMDFGKYVFERFTTRADVNTVRPLRARREIARGHSWDETFNLARANLIEGLASSTVCEHPPPRVSRAASGILLCRRCSSWRSLDGVWNPPPAEEVRG